MLCSDYPLSFNTLEYTQIFWSRRGDGPSVWKMPGHCTRDAPRGHDVLESLDILGVVRGRVCARFGQHNMDITSATRPCWSNGIGGCDAFMKVCSSSSGCASRPAKGQPARAGRSPCDGPRNAAGEASASKRVGQRTAAPQLHGSRMPSVFVNAKATTILGVVNGRVGEGIRRGGRLWHGRRGRPRNLGGPRLSSSNSGLTESR